mgnify:CR=1 FL=1
MQIITERLAISTKGDTDIIDLTSQLRETLQTSGLNEGQMTVFAPGATAGISTVEYEPGLLKDIPEVLERLIPEKAVYHHNETWHDGNGHSHVRATLVGPSITVPFNSGQLILGTWQQIVYLDFDNRRRSRNVVIQLIGQP